MLNFHEFDTLLFLEPRSFHDLSISVSKIRTRDLIIISNSSRSYQRDEEKFTPIQFISRSSNKEPRRCIALYLENVFIVGYVGKKKRKHERATDVASQQHPGPYPVVFFHPGASNIIFYLVEIERRRPNTTSSSWERTDRMYMRGVYIEAHPVVAVRTMPYPHRKSTVRFCGTKGRRSRRPVRAAILSDSVDGQERAGSRALKRKRGGRVACEGRREIPTVLRSTASRNRLVKESAASINPVSIKRSLCNSLKENRPFHSTDA